MVGAMQVVGRILLGLLRNQVSLRVKAAVVLGILPIGLLALLLISGQFGIVAFIVFFGASKGASTLVRPAFADDIFGRERYATIAGALAGFVMTATALAPISGGAAYDVFGSYDPMIWRFVLLSALSAAGAVLLVPQEAPTPEMPPTRAAQTAAA